jgi:uncharacterized lipoprotein YddW (UPF0748 family)
MFTDIQNHWAQESIVQLRSRNLINGYPDGTFRPNAYVTRAEFAAILARAFPNIQSIRSAIAFKDVSNRFWAASLIRQAYQTGFISGYPNGTFKPNLFISRLQVLLALVSGLKYTPSQGSTRFLAKLYDDVDQIPNYAVGAIVAATEKSLVVNYPNIKRLNPSQTITRGEVVAIICQALNIPGVPQKYLPQLPPQLAFQQLFDDADSFSGGRARVRIGDKWGYIDSTGKQVISPQFNDASSFSDTQEPQLALIKNQRHLELPLINFPISGAIAETRGVWITTTDSKVLFSRENIATAMEFLAQTGFNVVFPVVWNNGHTIYPSEIMRSNFGVEINPRFVGRDPLEELITEAKKFGLAVIPWFEYGFACSYAQNGGHILKQKPQWAARNLSGNLLSKNHFEWMNALDTEVQDFFLSLVLEVVRKYDIQGIQGDDRMPALPSEGGYDGKTVERYMKQFNQNPPQNPKDATWIKWRADILTNFLNRFYREIIKANPNLIISSSPSVFPWGLNEYLQDSQTWTDWGLVDLIHPQVYYRTFVEYRDLINRLLSTQFTPAQQPLLAPGILLKVGPYRISPEILLQKIQYNRDRGIKGEVLFFYEGLRENNDELAKALQSGAYAKPVTFNTASIKAQGFTRDRIGVSYSYINISGTTASQPQYDWVDDYSQGLARVRMGFKWGYINASGQLVGKLQFDAAEPFVKSNLDPAAIALALVKIGNKYGYINTSGEIVIPCKYDAVTSFQEGFAAVKILDKYGYIDTSGEIIIQPQFDEANLFSEGLAAIKLNGTYGYIDTTGTVIIPPQFAQAKSFSQGLAAVANGDQWGYINLKGETAIPLQFAVAESFSQNLAAVEIDNLWGYIDLTGKIAIQPTFDDAKPFREGLALIKQGAKWGYIKSPSGNL